MTSRKEDTASEDIIKVLMEHGLEGMTEAMEALMNSVMKIERDMYLRAGLHERSQERIGYANGYKPKRVDTRIGRMEFQIPQTRDGGFYPSSLEKGMRSERALRLSLAEMYVQGVSTRKVKAITERLCGMEISSTQVSRLSAELDQTLEAWRNRPLGCYPFVFLDARYEHVRHGGTVVDAAVLIAIGVTSDGKREVLGCSVELSESEVHWRNFMSNLQKRGLHGVRLLISDDHSGLKAARKAVFPSVPWQRCQFHLQQNAQKYVPRQKMKKQVASRIRAIFQAPDRQEAERLLARFIEEYRASAPRLATWAETALPEGFTVFAFDEALRRRLRTTNVLERVNKEIARRSRVATMFPNEASCLRLVSAVLIEISEEWLTSRRWLTIPDDG